MQPKSPPRSRANSLSSARNLLLLACLAFLLLAFWQRIVITVPSGYVGVLWLRFFGGTWKGFYYGEGTKVIFPWDRIFLYDARLRRLDRQVESLTRDGLKVDIDVTVTYFINKLEAAYVQENFGPAYEAQLIEPIVVSQLALFVADRNVEQMYSLVRSTIEATIINGIQTKIVKASEMRTSPHVSISVVDVNIRRVGLPPNFREAVESKLSAQQEIQRRQYLVEQQRLTNEQKIIEARGIETVQGIISPGLSEPYLQWEAIRAGAQLASSPNAKAVVFGIGGAHVPLLFGAGQAEPGKPAVPAVPGSSSLPSAPPPVSTMPVPALSTE